jgi:hypothetical protein
MKTPLKVVRCPTCKARLKTGAAPGVKLRCSKCKATLRLKPAGSALPAPKPTLAATSKPRSTPKPAVSTLPTVDDASGIEAPGAPSKPGPFTPRPIPTSRTASVPVKAAPPRPGLSIPKRHSSDDEGTAVSPKLLIALGALVTVAGIVIACSLFWSLGGDGPALAPVKGKVVYKGTHLTHGEVAFTNPEDKGGYQAIGFIQEDGTFELKTQLRKGAQIGNHVVTVYCREKVDSKFAKGVVVGRSLIPEKYGRAEQTPLRREVKRGQNDFLLELD